MRRIHGRMAVALEKAWLDERVDTGCKSGVDEGERRGV
jgi:hypothetical protein